MNELLREVYLSHERTFLDNYVRLHDFHKDTCTIPDSTSFQDCIFLYLLALRAKPELVLEAGTFVGATAKFLAEGCGLRKDCVHTSDIGAGHRSYIPSRDHDGSIVRHGSGMENLIDEFKREGKKAGLVFFDAMGWEDDDTKIGSEPNIFENLMEVVTDDFVFAAHDYTDQSGEPSKGAAVAYSMWKLLEPKGYKLFTPHFEQYVNGHYIKLGNETAFAPVNGCTVVITPPDFVRDLKAEPSGLAGPKEDYEILPAHDTELAQSVLKDRAKE